MTNAEAIETIKMAISEVEWEYPMDYSVALEMAIEAMEKQNKYKWHDLRINPEDLPTDNINDESVYFTFWAVIKDALEKQIPKKPEGRGMGYVDNRCPACKAYVSYELDYGGNLYEGFCPDCGQAIDWSGADETN